MAANVELNLPSFCSNAHPSCAMTLLVDATLQASMYCPKDFPSPAPVTFSIDAILHWQAVILNLRLCDETARAFRLEGHVCELQLVLDAFAIIEVSSQLTVSPVSPRLTVSPRSPSDCLSLLSLFDD